MTELSGLRVFLVEDEGFVALMIEDMLRDLGCEIAASVAQLTVARAIAATIEADLAVLDVNLDNQPVFPVAEILRERQMPILFSTGYGETGLPSEFSGYPVLGKPFLMTELQRKIASSLGR